MENYKRRKKSTSLRRVKRISLQIIFNTKILVLIHRKSTLKSLLSLSTKNEHSEYRNEYYSEYNDS